MAKTLTTSRKGSRLATVSPPSTPGIACSTRASRVPCAEALVATPVWCGGFPYLPTFQIGQYGTHPAVLLLAGLQAELGEDVPDVLLHRAVGHRQPLGDGAVG